MQLIPRNIASGDERSSLTWCSRLGSHIKIHPISRAKWVIWDSPFLKEWRKSNSYEHSVAITQDNSGNQERSTHCGTLFLNLGSLEPTPMILKQIFWGWDPAWQFNQTLNRFTIPLLQMILQTVIHSFNNISKTQDQSPHTRHCSRYWAPSCEQERPDLYPVWPTWWWGWSRETGKSTEKGTNQ